MNLFVFVVARATVLWWTMATTVLSAAADLEWRARSSLITAGSLSTTSSPDLGRHHPILFANESHAFMLGGTTYTAAAANDFYLYDVAQDVWTELQEEDVGNSLFPPARSYAYGVVLNELHHPKAYLGFGSDGDGVPLRDWWEFDMSTLTFRPLAPCPCLGRNHPSLVSVYTHHDNKWTIHMGLGDTFDDNGQFINLNDYWQYDIDTDTWQSLPDFPSSKRHHPYYFALHGASYVGLGHSGTVPFIERDFYSFHRQTNEWRREPDFASYESEPPVLTVGVAASSLEVLAAVTTSEARVAGTQFAIEFPLVGTTTGPNNLTGAIGFILSGDGDDHDYMEEGEFHAFYPATTTTTSTAASPAWWRQLTPHPGGGARWAPGSFVLRNTATAYFCCGYNRLTETLHSDLWSVDLSSLFTTTSTSTAAAGGVGGGNSSTNNNNNAPGPAGSTNGAIDPFDDENEDDNAGGSTSAAATTPGNNSGIRYPGTNPVVGSTSVAVVTIMVVGIAASRLLMA